MNEIDEAYGDSKTADIAICERVSEDLAKHYPGHPWAIGANHETGFLWIHLAYPDNRMRTADALGGASFGIPGWGIHIKSLKSKYDWNKVMKAGGELLERYGIARGAYRDGDWQKAKEHGMDV
jgi:hypothetical protein